MARVSRTRGYKGRGIFVLKPLTGGGRPFQLGNVTSLTENIEVNRTSRQNYQAVAGGELDVQEDITQFTAEITVNDITPQNIALGLRSIPKFVESMTQTGERVILWPGSPVGLQYIPDPAQTLTVTVAATIAAWASDAEVKAGDTFIDGSNAYLATVGGTTGPTEPTWPTDGSTVTDGTVEWLDIGDPSLADGNYERTESGILLSAAYGDPDTSVPVDVTYTRNPQYLIQALTDAGIEYMVEYHGLNAVDSGNPVLVRYFRGKFSPTSGFQRQGGDDFAELTLSMTVLADTSRTGQGESQYMEIMMV